MEPFKLICWDFDGTLFDDEGHVKVCQVRAICEFLGLSDWEKYVEPYYGVSLDDVVTALCVHAQITNPNQVGDIDHYLRPGIDAAINDYIQSPHARVCNGAAEGLNWVQAQGTMQALVTGASPQKVRLGLEVPLQGAGPLGRFFDNEALIISRGDQRIPDDLRQDKPHPGLLIHAMHVAGTAPDETLMIGDSTSDIEAAIRAGAYCIGYVGGSHVPLDKRGEEAEKLRERARHPKEGAGIDYDIIVLDDLTNVERVLELARQCPDWKTVCQRWNAEHPIGTTAATLTLDPALKAELSGPTAHASDTTLSK